jgi:hypothetical protein
VLTHGSSSGKAGPARVAREELSMKKSHVLGGAALGAFAMSLVVAACTNEDQVFAEDAGTDAAFDAARPDVAVPETKDSGPADGQSDAAVRDPRALVTLNNTTSSELVAVNLRTRAVDGRIGFPGFIGATYIDGEDPWLLQQAVDVVAKLDRDEPWKVRGTFDVKLTDKPDGGDSYADPIAVVASAGTKAYVLRYTRNAIAVIAPQTERDGAAPVKTIDLSSLVSPLDKDGLVEMTSAVYVAAKKRLYVTLANVDKGTSLPPHDDLPCPVAGPVSTVVAIDTDTDALVSLGGTGPGGGIALSGYNVAFGARSFYDAAEDRLLVLTTGCGPFSATQKRGIDEVKLATGAVKTLVNLSSQGFPSAFEPYGRKFLLGLGGQVFPWDPSKTTLEAAIPNAPSSFAFDGKDRLVGVRKGPSTDAGPGPLEIVRVPLEGDAGVETLTVNPFTNNDGFVGSVEVWPHP